jgi:hypothetical protein
VIRYVRALIPAALDMGAKVEWVDIRDRLRRHVDETRRALLALPRWQERALAYDPADGEVTVALEMTPRAVWCAYATAQGSTTPVATTGVTWRPGPDARSVVLSAVSGLSSGTRYDLRLFVAGVD